MLARVVEGDIRKSQAAARIVLEDLKSAKDERFRNDLLRTLDTKAATIELPYNLRGMLCAEDSAFFPIGKYYVTSEAEDIANNLVEVLGVSQKLMQKGIRYLPSLLLHGESGCGKTELARYIAHKADLQFVYIRFSGLIDSLLGKTQQNLLRVFESSSMRMVRLVCCALTNWMQSVCAATPLEMLQNSPASQLRSCRNWTR